MKVVKQLLELPERILKWLLQPPLAGSGSSWARLTSMSGGSLDTFW